MLNFSEAEPFLTISFSNFAKKHIFAQVERNKLFKVMTFGGSAAKGPHRKLLHINIFTIGGMGANERANERTPAFENLKVSLHFKDFRDFSSLITS